MEETPSLRKTVFEYTLAGILSLLAVGIPMKLWQADPHVPFSYEGDAIQHQLWIETMIETGWYRYNERFGAPDGMDLNEFPSADILHYAILWPLAKAFPDPALVFNIYYLLGCVLTSWTTLFVLRQLGLRFLPALMSSLLFTCLPFHFMRMGHFFLVSYWPIPLGILPAIRLYQGRPLSKIGTLIIGLILGLSGIYFAFFSCYFLLLCGLSRSLLDRQWKPLLKSIACIAVIFTTLLVALFPAIQHKRKSPFNPDAVYRLPAESETLGLKMMQLLVPVTGHRLPLFEKFKEHYSSRTPINTENQTATLGLIGAVGFSYLLLRFLLLARRPVGESENRLLDALALLAVGGFLLGTVGAFGSFFAFFVSPWIRGYNRISVFIGLFALASVALFLNYLLTQRATTTVQKTLVGLLIALLTVLGVADQTTPRLMPHFENLKRRYTSDKEFTANVERDIEPGKIVYQLPFRPYPEAEGEPQGILFKWTDLFRPQLHSRTLHWSFGAPRGRYGDAWAKRMESKPVEERLIALADADCAGVMVFREAYKDNAVEMERLLSQKLKTQPIVSPDERMSYFTLSNLQARRIASLDPEEWEKVHRQERYPVLGLWGKGAGIEFEGLEGIGRFCDSGTELRLVNPTEVERKIRLRIEVRLKSRTEKDPEMETPEKEATITLVDGQTDPKFPITEQLTTLEQDWLIPPGEKKIRIDCFSTRKHHFEVYKVECIDQ
ncbi:hypothetical protein KIH39_07080 [Telmatocola sphagniphila]|uniref:DUF6311 domain-containing protein n=1 Tax=Telmatocola sphagniphila TaxID=1123043 RepID=A0A8E6BB25_9BACT|nr:DUF5090 family protein [Telmatocola sphagniphila]QVL33665.1 hypothetical protein KIH39_07080 [Telmatocola sphagniphila]